MVSLESLALVSSLPRDYVSIKILVLLAPDEDDIARLRKYLSQIEDWFTGRWKNIKHRRKGKLWRKYSIKAKGFKTVTEELKERITPKVGKLKHYKSRVTQYRQNKLFHCNQKTLYEKLGGKHRKLVIHHRQTMLRNFGVRYRINLLSIKKMLNGCLSSKRNWKW